MMADQKKKKKNIRTISIRIPVFDTIKFHTMTSTEKKMKI